MSHGIFRTNLRGLRKNTIMIDLVAIATLVGVILMLVIDRYFIVEQHQKDQARLLEELSRATKAVISKNANEYVMTTSIDKVPAEKEVLLPPEETPEEALNDDQFFEAIGKSLKNAKN